MSSEETIDRLIEQFYAQNEVPMWVLSSTEVIMAIVRKRSVIYGRRGLSLKKLFSVTGNTFLSLLVMRLFGIFIVTLWWLRVRNVRQINAAAVELFVGFGAGPEADMFTKFAAENERPVAHLDQTNPASLATVAVPGLFSLLRTSWTDAELVIDGLRNSQIDVIRSHFRDWMASAARRFITSVFVKSWTRALPEQIRRIVFISPDVPAFAAIEANKQKNGIYMEFWQHGMLKKSVLIPRFDKAIAINLPEAQHLSRWIETVVHNRDVISECTLRYSANVLFASMYSWAEFDKSNYNALLSKVFRWFEGAGCRIIVRPHPCEADNFWHQYFCNILVDAQSKPFAASLETWQPLFIVSWYSTSLIDGLRTGILPVMLTEGSELALQDMVFPLAEVALNWPRDLALIEVLANDPELYRKELLSRQGAAFGTAG